MRIRCIGCAAALAGLSSVACQSRTYNGEPQSELPDSKNLSPLQRNGSVHGAALIDLAKDHAKDLNEANGNVSSKPAAKPAALREKPVAMCVENSQNVDRNGDRFLLNVLLNAQGLPVSLRIFGANAGQTLDGAIALVKHPQPSIIELILASKPQNVSGDETDKGNLVGVTLRRNHTEKGSIEKNHVTLFFGANETSSSREFSQCTFSHWAEIK